MSNTAHLDPLNDLVAKAEIAFGGKGSNYRGSLLGGTAARVLFVAHKWERSDAAYFDEADLAAITNLPFGKALDAAKMPIKAMSWWNAIPTEDGTDYNLGAQFVAEAMIRHKDMLVVVSLGKPATRTVQKAIKRHGHPNFVRHIEAPSEGQMAEVAYSQQDRNALDELTAAMKEAYTYAYPVGFEE
jgi:hypothetical protein